MTRIAALLLATLTLAGCGASLHGTVAPVSKALGVAAVRSVVPTLQTSAAAKAKAAVLGMHQLSVTSVKFSGFNTPTDIEDFRIEGVCDQGNPMVIEIHSENSDGHNFFIPPATRILINGAELSIDKECLTHLEGCLNTADLSALSSDDEQRISFSRAKGSISMAISLATT